MRTHAPAVIVAKPGSISVADVGVPHVGPRDVLIRTLFSGVSTGTDKWVMRGDFTWIGLEFPLVPGYQRVGIVEAIGHDVSEFRLGQDVVATASRPFVDAFPGWGGHASLATSPCDEVYGATGIVPERASLFISGQVGFNAASRLREGVDRRVVVFGDGIIGTSGALAARARGCDVLLVGRHPERMERLSDFSIATAQSGAGSADAVRDWDPTAVIDTIQSEAAFADYVDSLPMRTGLIVFSGHSPNGTKAWTDMEYLQQRELTAAFVSGWAPDRIESTLGLMRDGRMPLETFAETAPATDDTIAETMRDVASGTLRGIAAVLDWRSLR